ncbi:MAG: YggS family pyridoxal phosphate-dependent enzyme [Acidimicrobiales bacterium]|nr:YggS family pyridoxal phosphate-dependent enzyme [Acidimicrobiales bacterium]
MNSQPGPPDFDHQIALRLAEVLERIDAVRQPGQSVTLIAVSKRFDASVVAGAVQAGCTDFGENYAQELAGKAETLRSLIDPAVPIRWHMIGPVQRNKVRRIAALVTLWHTIDREPLIEELAKRSPGAELLLQVNLTGEASKSGCDAADLGMLVEHAHRNGLGVRGLMTMGPTDTAIDPAPVFARCRELADHHGLEHCSMGMSGDFETAIVQGSTMVRVGTAIFGPRP